MIEWSTAEVAEHLGLAPSGVHRWARRNGVGTVRFGRSPSGRVTALYSAAEVQAARATQPGKGNRQPRSKQEDQST